MNNKKPTQAKKPQTQKTTQINSVFFPDFL